MIIYRGLTIELNLAESHKVIVQEYLGAGAYGDVWKVRDTMKAKYYALKHLRLKVKEPDKLTKLTKRIQNEAMIRIDSPYIVKSYGLKQLSSLEYCILFEYVPGDDLDKWLNKRKDIEWETKKQVFLQILEGVAAAHKQGVIHRDLKPENIIVTAEDIPKILDFGLARVKDQEITETGDLIGTLPYMGPEILAGAKKINHQFDIYSLGCILYVLVRGQNYCKVCEYDAPPFGQMMSRGKLSTGNILDFDTGFSSSDPAVKNAIKKSTVFDPKHRLQDIERFLKILEGDDEHEPIIWKWGQRLAPIGGAIVALMLVIGLLSILASLVSDRDIVSPTSAPMAPMSAAPFTIHPYDAEQDTDAECLLCPVTSSWEDPKKPGHYPWQVSFPTDKPALLEFGWCAIDQPTLRNNWEKIEYSLFVDEYQVDLSESFIQRERYQEGKVCNLYYGVLTGWKAGAHTILLNQNMLSTLSDGNSKYEPGEYMLEFEVNLVEVPTATPAPTAPLTLDPYDAKKDTDAECLLCPITNNWVEPTVPGEYEWEVSFPANKPALLHYGWCASNRQILNQNRPSVWYELIVDGSQVEMTTLTALEKLEDNRACYLYYGVVRDWSEGQHSVIWKQHITEALSDGWREYEQGEYVLEFQIEVNDVITPTQPPKSDSAIRAYDPQRDTDAECVICSVTEDWNEPKKAGHYQWAVSFPADKLALLSYGWCARDQQTLYDNWSSITYRLVLDEQEIDLSQFLLREEAVGNEACYFYYGVLTGWESGRHSLIWIQDINQELNNGWNSYEPGLYALEFEVELVDQIIQSASTPVPPISIPVPPTAIQPTSTPVPPIAMPPTSTPVQPTFTPVPPTATPLPPTAVISTNTPLPPPSAIPTIVNTYSAEEYLNRGNDYLINGQYDQAISNFNEAIRLNPTYAEAYNLRGIAYRLQRNLAQAIADHHEAIRLVPTYIEAHYQLGNAYYDQANYEQAIAAYSETIRLGPTYAKAFSSRGLVYEIIGNREQAIADYQKALELNNNAAAIQSAKAGLDRLGVED